MVKRRCSCASAGPTCAVMHLQWDWGRWSGIFIYSGAQEGRQPSVWDINVGECQCVLYLRGKERGNLREAGLMRHGPPKLAPCCWKEGCKASKISDTSCLDYNTALQERILRSWEFLQSVTIHHKMGFQEHLCFWRTVARSRRKWATGMFFLK